MPKKSKKPKKRVALRQGALLLLRELKKRGLSVNGAGELLGAQAGMVSRWLRCERIPGTRWSTSIEDAFGVPARAWLEPAVERARATPAQEAA